MASSPDMPALLDRLTALGDLARLRILRLLGGQELSVGELARALQLPQSTVSRHLKLLHGGRWIIKRSQGTASMYSLVEEALDESSRALWAIARGQIGSDPPVADDDHRLREVLAARAADTRSFFGRLGGDWDRLRNDLFGQRFTREALLGFVPPDWTVADLGCGTGNAAELLAPFVRKIIAVDREPAMLESARARLADLENVEFRTGELTALPIADAALDAAIVVLVLHHLPQPRGAVREAARVLRRGGTLLVVDMVAHDRQSYRRTMGHRHLGFGERTVRGWARAAGLTWGRYHRLRPDTTAKGPGLFVATMIR